ncbi:unnamed protein product, partial [Sphacelaria rigidula]
TPASNSLVVPDAPGKGSGMVLRARSRGGGEKCGGRTINNRKTRVTRQDTRTAAPTGGRVGRRNPSRAARKKQSVATAHMEAPAASAVRSRKRGRHADGEGDGEYRRTKRRQASGEGRAAVAASGP